MQQDHPLVCPQCKKLNQRSIVEGESPWQQFGDYKDPKEYYDQEGRRHVHDPNKVFATWKCDKGHRFNWYVRAGCVACGQTQENLLENLQPNT